MIFLKKHHFLLVFMHYNFFFIMYKILSRTCVSMIIFASLLFSQTHAFIGLIAEAGDVLNVSKWNEMIEVLNGKIEAANIIEGPGIDVSVNGNDVTISATGWGSWWGVAPFLNPENLTLISNTNYNLVLEWVYFTPTTWVSISGGWWTINSVDASSPTEIQLDITTWPTVGSYDFILDNAGTLNTLWPGNGEDYMTLVSQVTGTGPAGTYTEWFEANLWSWVDWGGQQAWLRDSAGTPSWGTGPNTWNGSTFYVYTETSGNGTGYPNRTFILETSDFSVAQSISFDYHAFGDNMWTLELQTRFNWVWTTRNTISGQQQNAQWNPYLSTTVDLSSFPVESIRFFYTSGTDFEWDFALDNVSIISN